MTQRFDPERHHRRSIRLKGYDYALAGAYFVTICAAHREMLFGEIADGVMQPREAGRLVVTTWESLPQRFPTIRLDVFVVMPNHVHGIVILGNLAVGAGLALPSGGAASSQGAASSAPTLGEVMRAFKSLSALAVHRSLGRSGQSLWQRNYYERIIRNEREHDALAAYILNNPAQWASDRENPIVARL